MHIGTHGDDTTKVSICGACLSTATVTATSVNSSFLCRPYGSVAVGCGWAPIGVRAEQGLIIDDGAVHIIESSSRRFFTFKLYESIVASSLVLLLLHSLDVSKGRELEMQEVFFEASYTRYVQDLLARHQLSYIFLRVDIDYVASCLIFSI
jgi:hypothetical protein